MQLSYLNRPPTWYFIFGSAEKSSLAQQFATEHKLIHLQFKQANETTFSIHMSSGIVVQCTPAIFRMAQSLQPNVFVIILEGDLSAEEIQIKRDYERIGRCISLKTANYKLLRKEAYPKLIVLFGPNKAQTIFLCQNYFNYSGYNVIQDTVTANELVAKLYKAQNFILTGFVPHLSELNILEQFFNVHIIHLKHQRSELSSHEDFFNLQAKIVPQISKKSYFHTVDGGIPPMNIGAEIGKCILPQLIFVNAKDDNQRKGVTDYILKSDGLLLNMSQIDIIYYNQKRLIKNGLERIQELVSIIYKNINRKQIFLINYPINPQDFFVLKDKTRPITLFADCLKPQNYQFSDKLTPAIHFLETHVRKHIELDFSFEKQIGKTTKYIIVNGPPCVGKTSAAKYISSSFGYKHIQYDSYVASIKEKLIAPEDGEELPFHKINKHFNSLIVNSGQNPILIDGINVEWKDLDSWVALNGPPVVFNLKTDEKELIRRTRRKNQADVNAEVTEQQAQKAKQVIAKNNDWADQLGARCPAATLYQIDFTPQLIKAEKLLDQILKPRVFLTQENASFLFQNIAIKNNLGYFDLRTTPLKDIAIKIRQGNYRNVVINNYNQQNQHLVCQDFHEIQKLVGSIRYLAVWNPEAIVAHDQQLKLQAPPKEEKPKPAEGEQGVEVPPAEEQGEVKKKALNIYDFNWTKPGNQKNMSQWFFKLKKNVTRRYSTAAECYTSFQKIIKSLAENKDLTIYDSIVD